MVAACAGGAWAVDCNGDGIDDAEQTYFWQTETGFWGTPSSWQSLLGGVPGASSVAVFDGDLGLSTPPYAALLQSSVSVRGLSLLNAETTLDLQGQVLDVTGELPGCRELLVGGVDGAVGLVTGGGQLRSRFARLADVPGSFARLVIDGQNGATVYRHLSQSPLVIGEFGTGVLRIESSVFQHDGLVLLGEEGGSLGVLEATGTGVLRLALETTSTLEIGRSGSGLVRLVDSASFDNGGAIAVRLGSLPGGSGELDLNGVVPPQFVGVSTLDIGFLGEGLLRVRQGAALETPASVRAAIGTLDGSDGDARVTTGASWVVDGQPLQVGPGGFGRVAVGESAVLQSGFGVVAFVDGAVEGSGVVAGPVLLAGGEIAPTGQFAVSSARQQLRFLDTVDFVATNPLTGLVETGRLSFLLNTADPLETMSAVVDGAASVGGTLRVRVLGFIDPLVGVKYPVLEAGQLSGVFAGVQSTVTTNGLVAVPVYPGDGVAAVEFVDLGVVGATTGPPVVFAPPANFTDGKVVDVTGDGYPDLVALSDNGAQQQGDLLVFKNLGVDGLGQWLGFGEPPDVYGTLGDLPGSVDVGDMNGDERPDIVMINRGPEAGQVRIRLNDPSNLGDFSQVDPRVIGVPGVPIDLVLADTGGDGALDVVTVFERAFSRGSGDGGVQNSENNGGGGFDDTDDDTGDDPGSVDTMGGAISPTGIVVSSKGTNSAWVYETAGVLRGTPPFPLFLTQVVPTGRSPREVFTADLTGDGLDEIVTSDGRSGTISVLRAVDGGPGEVFYADAVSLRATRETRTAQPGSIVALDVNEDGRPDLAYAARDEKGVVGIWSILNLGEDGASEAMLFSDPETLPGDDQVGSAPVVLAVGDVNQDGREDLVALRENGSAATVSVHLAAVAGPCNAADLSLPFGVLDLGDLNAFVQAFVNQTPAADLAAPFGVWDLADLTAFVGAFLAGCP
jgi:hypothetical protein